MNVTWFTLSLNEWQRRPVRMAVTTMGVAIAIAALFSLLAFQDGYRAGMKSELDHLGAHILVVPKGCPYDAASIALHGANWPCYLKLDYLAQVRAVAGVATAAPVLMTAFYGPDGTQTVYAGVDPDILKLKSGWHIDGRFPESEGDLLSGADVARRNHWRVGQLISLPELHGGQAKLAGVLAPTQGPDDGFLFLRLADAQRLFRHEHELTHILVKLTDPDQLDRAVGQLRGCGAGLGMNVVPLSHLFGTIQSLVSSTRLWLGCVALVALLVAGAGVSNALLMAVAERTREIGVLRAIGASRGDIFRLIWLETIQVCFGGAIIGLAAAFAASRGVESWLRGQLPFAPAGPLLLWEWSIATACLGCALALGSLAGFLPAARAACLSPVEAIRSRGGGI